MKATKTSSGSGGKLVKAIRAVEIVGNKIPHPFFMFLYLAIIILVLSWGLATLGVQASYISAGSDGALEEVTVSVRNLLSAEYFHTITSGFTKTYINFAPLGLIMVMMLSIGFAQATGLFDAALRKVLLGAPPFLVTFVICLVGVCANIASNAGIVLASTLGAAIFASLGRNPILGAICGFTTCYGAWSANLMVAGTDVLLAGITQAAAEGMGISAPAHPMINYFFMASATLVISIVATFITEKIMPNVITIGKVTPAGQLDGKERVTPAQNRGLRWAGIAAIVYVVILLFMTVPKNAILRAEDGSLIPSSPLVSGIVALLFAFFMATGIAYGIGCGTITKKEQIPAMMGEGLVSSLAFYVIALPAAFFIQFFGDSKIGTVIAVLGGEALQALNFDGIPLLVAFVVLCAFINLFMTGATEKWMILAPIFVPIFSMMGYSPALTQLAYRIGDSIGNPISPVATGIPILLAILEKYRKEDDPEYGVGTVISLALPYSIAFLVSFTLLMIVFVVFNIPIGPGAYIHLS